MDSQETRENEKNFRIELLKKEIQIQQIYKKKTRKGNPEKLAFFIQI
jgi:hypothetical protein